MNGILKSISVILLFYNGLAASENYAWQKIPSPDFSNPQIICAKQQTDFWLLDENGFLFHYQNGNWQSFPVPGRERLHGFRAARISQGLFLVSGYDAYWKTSLFWLKNGRWQQDTLTIANPIKGIHPINGHLIYLTGDWATLWRYDHRQWKKLALPFKTHYHMLVVSPSEMYLGTRGQGIYKFDGQSFEKLPVEGAAHPDISSMVKTCNGDLFFTTSSGAIFHWQKDRFVRTQEPFPGQIKRTIQFVYLKDVRIPGNIDFRNYFEVDSSRFLIITRKGEVYFNRPAPNNRFYDLAEAYHLERNRHFVLNGASFVALNSDSLPDLFLQTQALNEYCRFYLNQNNRPFTDITAQTKFFSTPHMYRFLLNDFDGDARTDLCTLKMQPQGSVLQYFLADRKMGLFAFDSVGFGAAYSQKHFTELYAADFNRDGKLDVGISTFFDKNLHAGHQLFLLNRGLPLTSPPDSQSAASNGWTKHVIWADFNKDDLNDLLLVNQWQPFRLLLASDSVAGGLHFTPVLLPTDPKEAAIGAAAFDFDNDGDLDLIYSSDLNTIRLLENTGQGNFRPIHLACFRALNRHTYDLTIPRFILICDVNNDGFEDFLFSLNAPDNCRNYLFLNRNGRNFVEAGEAFNVAHPALLGAVSADVDADGDMDIFGYTKDQNVLWINDLDDKNYLEVIPRGVRSNSFGLGAKISVFPAGQANNPQRLLAFRQLGSRRYAADHQNQLMAHFGLPDTAACDVVVAFYGGKTITLKNVRAGQILIVPELSGARALMYRLPGDIRRFFATRDNRLYALITLLAFAILFLSGWYGANKLHWNSTTVMLVNFMNLLVFWLLLISNADQPQPFFRFFLPLTIVTAGALFPILFTRILSRSLLASKKKEDLEHELLENLLLFNHGEWASKNLLGLRLLLNNAPENKADWPEFERLVRHRLRIFQETNLPLILRIQRLLAEHEAFKTEGEQLKSAIHLFKQKTIRFDRAHQPQLKGAINTVYETLKRIRDEVFGTFSCDPGKVVLNLVVLLEKSPATFQVFRNYEGAARALIKQEELTLVLDNLLQNALKAVAQNQTPQIKIHLLKKTPKFLIEVSDNGAGLPSGDTERIFEKGFSRKGGTGLGLFYSKQIIEKYHGRIFVKESQPARGTTMTVELQEVE